MKHILTIVFSICISLIGFGQQEFHVFPIDDSETPGTKNGTGSITSPWDLQTALSQKIDIVTSGDTIWLHQGIYDGRFVSTLQSPEEYKFITVSGYKNDKVVLNGNVNSLKRPILEVRGKQVIYKNFEITCLGDFSRNENDEDFEVITGINHASGENCQFLNLKVYNNPGLGIGSWKRASGTIIENCMIFNNGFISKGGKGRGEGMYIQNKSDETRVIRNNIIFNNYYKGIEVWSAGEKADYQYVKNIRLEGNIIFNNGSPSGVPSDNVIVASNDQNGINIANNITLLHNILYHNTHDVTGKRVGEAPSLTFGFNKNAPIKDVSADGNIIIGGYNVLRLSIAESLKFTNNIIYGAVQIGPNTSSFFKNWSFNSNTYYTKLKTPFRISRGGKYSLETWQQTFQLEEDSEVFDNSDFNLNPVLHISKQTHKVNKYQLALFNTEGKNVTIDFSEYSVKPGLKYKIYDVENLSLVLKSGEVSDDLLITFPMELTAFEKPLHNLIAQKTVSNFGVFVIEFEDQQTNEVEQKKTNFLKRFFKWLGF